MKLAWVFSELYPRLEHQWILKDIPGNSRSDLLDDNKLRTDIHEICPLQANSVSIQHVRGQSNEFKIMLVWITDNILGTAILYNSLTEVLLSIVLLCLYYKVIIWNDGHQLTHRYIISFPYVYTPYIYIYEYIQHFSRSLCIPYRWIYFLKGIAGTAWTNKMFCLH